MLRPLPISGGAHNQLIMKTQAEKNKYLRDWRAMHKNKKYSYTTPEEAKERKLRLQDIKDRKAFQKKKSDDYKKRQAEKIRQKKAKEMLYAEARKIRDMKLGII